MVLFFSLSTLFYPPLNFTLYPFPVRISFIFSLWLPWIKISPFFTAPPTPQDFFNSLAIITSVEAGFIPRTRVTIFPPALRSRCSLICCSLIGWVTDLLSSTSSGRIPVEYTNLEFFTYLQVYTYFMRKCSQSYLLKILTFQAMKIVPFPRKVSITAHLATSIHVSKKDQMN